MRRTNAPAIDPRTSLVKGCITTDGGTNYHYNGTRKCTVRELSLYQTFKISHIWTGNKIDALRQIGNGFPPATAEVMFTAVIRTLEAFDNGLISAEDELSGRAEFCDVRKNLSMQDIAEA
jgi:DNA (cytosine-5)-methyltransferase 1